MQTFDYLFNVVGDFSESVKSALFELFILILHTKNVIKGLFDSYKSLYIIENYINMMSEMTRAFICLFSLFTMFLRCIFRSFLNAGEVSRT